MVGGKVINVVHVSESTWVQCEEKTSYSQDTCAIRIETNREIKPGDALWWQAGRAYWTPKPFDGREDIALRKVGYSHGSIPDDVMAAALHGATGI